MRRFDRALTREMAATSALAFAALAAIFIVVLLARTLGKAVMGDVTSQAVLPMLTFGLVHFLPVLLSLALFIGVFVSLSRLWRDSEAIIWMNAGVGPLSWVRAVALFSLPMVALISLVSLSLVPWSALKQAEFERLMKTRDEVSSLAPGRFAESAQHKQVYFVESVADGGLKVGNVFVQSSQQGRMGVIIARQGHVKNSENGDRFLVLEQGRRYEGVPGQADFRVGQFASYGVRIQPQVYVEPAGSARTLGVQALLAQPTPRNMGEWVWRIGYPLSALVLSLLAVPLSYVNPRAGHSLNVLFAILIYVAYNNFVGLSEGWVSRGRVSATEALLLVHGVMFVSTVLFFWQRFRGPWSR